MKKFDGMEIFIAKIDGDYIELDALLKLTSVANTGGQAKLLIQNGEVEVNEVVCTERSRKITRKDQVSLGDTLIKVV